MKITADALEMAKASARESEVPLILVGERSVITDVMIAPDPKAYDTSAGQLISMLPVGIRRYGKVVTRASQDLEPGYNLIEVDGEWKFLDGDGKEVHVPVVESADDRKCG